MPTADSLQRLEGLAAAGATGELVCATSNAEVHIHLQEGRIAWATTSLAKLAFTRYVVEACEIDADALRELVLECQRERKPLGETLIAWGVATTEQVRSALRRQIVEAVGTLEGNAETVFLRRGSGYRSYNDGFTFPLREISRLLSPSTPPDRLASRPSSLPPPDGPRARLRSLLAQEPGIRWADLYRGDERIDGVPPSRSREPFSDVLGGLLPELARSVVIRRQGGSVVGFALDEADHSVWCGLAPNPLVATMRIVQEHMGASSGSDPVGDWRSAPALIGEDRGIPRAALTEAMLRSDFLSAVALSDADGAQHYLAWRQNFDRSTEEARLAALSTLLTSVGMTRPASVPGPPSRSPSSISASCAGRAIFGGELTDSTGRHLWLIFDALGNHGLGWALLTALLRRTNLTRRELGR